MGMALVSTPATTNRTGRITNSPIGKINVKCNRMSQAFTTRWSFFETSAGVYDSSRLAELDALISFNRANGINVIFGLYGTPTFYANNVANNPNFPDSVTRGPWGDLGEGAFPSNLNNAANANGLTALTNFVNMIMTRYNTAGGAWGAANSGNGQSNFVRYGRGIRYWETGNEPAFSGNGNVTGVNGNGAGFWWGTAAQLSDYCYTQYAAVKAIDSGCIVLCPGFSPSGAGTLTTHFSTVGTVTGKTGAESCDWYNYHQYGYATLGMTLESANRNFISGPAGIQTFKNVVSAGGWNRPFAITEEGLDESWPTTTTTAFENATPTYRYQWYARRFMHFAAFGCQSIHPWNWASGNNSNSANWQDDTEIQRAYNEAQSKLSGKTILPSSYRLPQGVTRLNFSDGTFWEV